MASVSFNDVSKKFGEFVAVDDLNLEISDKEFLVLLGPSGCGKTTTMRMVAGLEEATSGDIYIGADRVNDVLPKYRDVAMVFQSYALLSAPHGRGQYRLPAEDPQSAAGRTPTANSRGRAARRTRRDAVASAEGAVRRPAPACCARPRHRPHAAGVSHGRAAVQSRRQASRPDAGRAEASPARAAGDDDLCHPRPDRGDDARPPRGRDEQGRDRAARNADGRSTTIRARSSSPASSARRR